MGSQRKAETVLIGAGIGAFGLSFLPVVGSFGLRVFFIIFLSIAWVLFRRSGRLLRFLSEAAQIYDQKNTTLFLQKLEEYPGSNEICRLLDSLCHQALEERLDKETALEALMEGVVAVDADMKVRYVNFIGSRILGVPKRYLVGRLFAPKKGALFMEKSRALLDSCQRLHAVVTDSVFLEVGKKMHLDLIAVPRENGKGAILILQDKSSQHQVLEMGKDFVASSSHELKTPLTIIRGFAETLQDIKDLPREIVDDIVDKIVRNCRRMDALIRNLLTLADIESLPWTNCQPCDLVSVIEECMRIVASVHPTARITFVKEVDSLVVEAEPSLLELAILNLLSNAAKYSEEPAEITVYLREATDEVEIAVADKGMGIPAEELEHVFEKFYTVNKAHSRKLGGAGLGLSLVKTIIEKHDGVVRVSSVLGEGSTFTIGLPFRS